MQPPFDPQQTPTGANVQPPLPPQGQYPQGPYPPGQYSQQGQYPGGQGAYSQHNQQSYPGQAWPGASPMAAQKQSIDLGRIFSTTFRIYKASLGKFLGISAITTAISMIIVIGAMVAFSMYLFGTLWENVYSFFNPEAFITSIIGVTVAFIIVLMVVALAISWAGYLGTVAEADANLVAQNLSVGQAMGIGFKRAFSTVPIILVLGLGIGAMTWAVLVGLVAALENMPISSSDYSHFLAALLGVIGLVTVVSLAFAVIQYIVIVKCFLTFPIMIAEGLNVWAAAKRSWSMTKGTAGMIFLLIFLTNLIIGTLSQVISLPAMFFMPAIQASIGPFTDPTAIFSSLGGLYAWIGIATFIVSLFTMPIMPIMMSVVYRDRKALEASHSG